MSRFSSFLTGFCVALWLVAQPLSALASEPKVPAKKALELAQEQLDIRGFNSSVYIDSLALKASTLMGGAKSWTILWSERIPLDGGLVEIGASVDMNGKVERLVKKASAVARTSP